MSPVPEIRLRRLNEAPLRGDGAYVLYWMIATRRLSWSYALDRALEHARELGRPLLIFEPISVGYRWASDRTHQAILDGMAEHTRTLEASPVGYYPYVEPERHAGRGLLGALAARACVVVTDDTPTFSTPKLLDAAARLEACRVEAVDDCGLLPLRATDRTFGAAYHFRRFLQKELPEHLHLRPSPDSIASARVPPFGDPPVEVVERWPVATLEVLEDRRTLADLPIDHSVSPTAWRGGHAAARARLDAFLDHDLVRYAEERNDPDAGVSSGLSPWLHFGHISTHEIFAAIADRDGWSPARISQRADGRRSGWWGMSSSAEALLDQLVTWRELGFGFCARRPGYAAYESLPDWALQTFEDHLADPRPHLYTSDEFTEGATHDELWNAAQRQLVREGTIHPYLRMLWGKKILEWSAHPRDALTTMIELNNRYALDGRDPNSYNGIFWVLGRFDRGWPERPIYGKVRSMSSAATRRKVDVAEYLARHGASEVA